MLNDDLWTESQSINNKGMTLEDITQKNMQLQWDNILSCQAIPQLPLPTDPRAMPSSWILVGSIIPIEIDWVKGKPTHSMNAIIPCVSSSATRREKPFHYSKSEHLNSISFLRYAAFQMTDIYVSAIILILCLLTKEFLKENS